MFCIKHKCIQVDMSRGIIKLPLAEAIQNEMMLSHGDSFSLPPPSHIFIWGFGAFLILQMIHVCKTACLFKCLQDQGL